MHVGRMIRPRFVMAAAALLAIVVAGCADDAPTRSSAGHDVLGVFRGSDQPSRVEEFERTFDVRLRYVLDFIGAARGAGDPWTGIDEPGDRCAAWAGTPWQIVFSVAMLPSEQFDLRNGASGAYDVHWQRFGRALVDAGCGSAVLRLGWEFNGRFFAWSAGGSERVFARYWRRIVTVLRAVPGEHFRFDWSVLAGNAGADVEAAWPGGDVVDYIGLDAYDTSRSSNDPDERWRDQLDRRYGLRWHERFAHRHGKPMTFPEWGVTRRHGDDLGGGDNPTYIERMARWIREHDVTYAIYFDVDARDADHSLTHQFPRARAAFRAVAPSLTSRR